jgi:hypothetical protein
MPSSAAVPCRVLVGAAALAALFGSARVVRAQITLQHTSNVDLSSQFFGATPPDGSGTPASQYGWNPLSIAFDGTNAYVGGYNSGAVLGSSNQVGIVKIQNVTTAAAPVLQGLSSTVFTANSFRGINDMGFDPVSGALYAAYDSGSSITSSITKYDTSGNQLLQALSPDNQRPFSLAIDPVGDSGLPIVAFLAQGSGRRLGLRTGDLSLLYTISGESNPGAIINGSPTNIGTAWRAMAFDSAGNIVLGEDSGVLYGVRNNANQFKTTAGTLNVAGNVVRKIADDNTVKTNNVGLGVGILKGFGAGGADLIALQQRTNNVGGIGSFTDLTGGTTTFNETQVQVRNLNGTTTGLTQTTLNGDEDGVGGVYAGGIKNFAFANDASGRPTLVVVGFDQRRLDVYSLEPTWSAAGGGTWGTTGNWLSGFSPNNSLDNARFGPAITAPSLISLESGKTVKVVKFDNANKITLAGPGALTLDSAGTPQINVISGASHEISAPVVLSKSSALVVPAGSTLTISGNLTAGSTIDLTKNGAGTAALKHLEAGSLNVNAGTVSILPSVGASTANVVKALNLAGTTGAWTSTLDLASGALIIDHDGMSPIAQVADQIKQGYASGSWNGNGITSSAAAAASGSAHKTAIGYAEASGPGTFLGQNIDGTAVLLRYVYTGDANLDGTVDTLDFNSLAGNFGGTGKVWSQADFNYDGVVDTLDFNHLAANFGQQISEGGGSSLGAVVPEPATSSLILLVGSAFAFARRRRAHSRHT